MDLTPLFLLAHGAGAPSSSPWMRRWADRLGTLGPVVPFDYPYMREGRKTPDRQPVLLAAHEEALAKARLQHGGDRPVVLAGKSMGSRMGCHLAVQLTSAAGVPISPAPAPTLTPPSAIVCFGYPLRAPGSGALRDAVLRELRTPILFVQGTRDPLCPLADLERVRGQLAVASQLFVVEGGDHSLEIGRRRQRAGEPDQEACDQRILDAVRRFLQDQRLLEAR